MSMCVPFRDARYLTIAPLAATPACRPGLAAEAAGCPAQAVELRYFE